MKKIDFMFFDAGGGHRAAALALQQVIASQQRPWEVRLVDVQDMLDELDIFRKYTGLRLEEIYNALLAKGWTLGSAQLLAGMHLVIRAFHHAQVRVFSRHWKANKPDLVLSVIPNFNRSMLQALRAVDPAVPYVTLLTDMADYPPHFWIERQRQTFICGTDAAAAQARAIASPGSTVHQVSGMILNPKFYDVPPVDRGALLRQYGLDPGIRTGLVLFGGEGSPKMEAIYDRIDASDLPVQLLLLCGKNAPLAERLRARRGRLAKHVEGFTSQVPAFMQIADFFIGKPGPGSVSEALHMGLPVIVEKNAWTLPQERFNADWVATQGVGESLPSFGEIVPALRRMLAPARWDELQRNVSRIHNRAIFEVPEILHTILKCPDSSL